MDSKRDSNWNMLKMILIWEFSYIRQNTLHSKYDQFSRYKLMCVWEIREDEWARDVQNPATKTKNQKLNGGEVKREG